MIKFFNSKIARALTAVAFAAGSTLTSSVAAQAVPSPTSGSVTPTTNVKPGTVMTYTVNDPEGLFCDTADGTNVAIYVNFFNADNVAVAYSYDTFEYDTAGTSYTFSYPLAFAYPGGEDITSKNWTLTPRFTCWDGEESEVTQYAPTVAAIQYKVIALSDNTPATGSTQTATIYDGVDGWCQDSGNANGGALVTLTDSEGATSTIPENWQAGDEGVASSFDDGEYTVTFVIPAGLASGKYTASFQCLSPSNNLIDSAAAATFTIAADNEAATLANTGSDNTWLYFGLLLLGAGVFLNASRKISKR